MGEYEPAHIEFEMLGETEVGRRVADRVFDGPTRAMAMRWLNDRAMARANAAVRARGRVTHDWESQLQHAQRTARSASAAAVLALVVAVVAAGLAAEALRHSHANAGGAETLAEAIAAAPPAEPPKAPAKPRRHVLAP